VLGTDCMAREEQEVQSMNHGTLSCYTGRRCRCDACRAANASRTRDRRLSGLCVECTQRSVNGTVRCAVQGAREMKWEDSNLNPDNPNAVTALNYPEGTWVPADEWRQIETAPKDGTAILAYEHWQGKTGGDRYTAYWQECGHWSLVRSGDYSSDDRVYPTHWLPLPEPPK